MQRMLLSCAPAGWKCLQASHEIVQSRAELAQSWHIAMAHSYSKWQILQIIFLQHFSETFQGLYSAVQFSSTAYRMMKQVSWQMALCTLCLMKSNTVTQALEAVSDWSLLLSSLMHYNVKTFCRRQVRTLPLTACIVLWFDSLGCGNWARCTSVGHCLVSLVNALIWHSMLEWAACSPSCGYMLSRLVQHRLDSSVALLQSCTISLNFAKRRFVMRWQVLIYLWLSQRQLPNPLFSVLSDTFVCLIWKALAHQETNSRGWFWS